MLGRFRRALLRVVSGLAGPWIVACHATLSARSARDPARRVLLLYYSALDPALTNERCSPWHFRFDAHADMRMAALMSVLREDRSLKSVYLIGQDYSFGQAVLREARRQLVLHRPDMRIAGDELHPLLRVKDFAPYAVKIQASGADAVIGGHPHVTQNIEIYKDKPIFYSLGNFVFDGFTDEHTRTGWGLRLILSTDGKLDWKIIEARIDRSGVPHPGREFNRDYQ